MARRRRGTLGSLTALVVTGLLLACLATARSGDPRLYPARSGDGVTVYLVDNGFHSDLVLPRKMLAGHVSGAAAALATTRPWVAVGWGDERFFIERGASLHRVIDGVRALFAPNNPSAVRFDGLATTPDHIWSDGVHRLTLSRAGP